MVDAASTLENIRLQAEMKEFITKRKRTTKEKIDDHFGIVNRTGVKNDLHKVKHFCL